MIYGINIYKLSQILTLMQMSHACTCITFNFYNKIKKKEYAVSCRSLVNLNLVCLVFVNGGIW